MKKEKYFVRTAFRRFLVPSLLSALGLALGGLADCLFIGKNIGEQGLATIAFGAPIYMLSSMISIGISLGGSIYYSHYLSQGKVKEGNNIFYNVLFFNLAVQIMISILGQLLLNHLMVLLGVTQDAASDIQMVKQYLILQLRFLPIMFSQAPLYYFVHCDNNPKLAAAALVIGNGADIISNYFLVDKLGLGVKGSVYSTVIGAVICIVICMTHIVRKKGMLEICRFQLNFRYILLSLKTGFATASKYLYQFITLILINNILMQYYGVTGVAVFDIIYNISLLISAVCDGMELTMEPMITTFAGEKNHKNVKQTFKLSIIAGLVISLLLMMSVSLGGEQYCRLFGLKEEGSLYLGVYSIWIFGISVIPYVFNSIFTYYYQSIRKEWISYAICFARYFAFFILYLFLFSRAGVVMFYFTYFAAELTTAVILLIYGSVRKNLLYLDTISQEGVFSLFLDPKTSNISEILQEVEQFYEEQDADFSKTYFTTLVIEEVCGVIAAQAMAADAVKAADPDKASDASIANGTEQYIQITITHDEEGFTLFIRDNAVKFNPFELNEEKLSLEDEGMDEINAVALSMKIVKAKTREFFYRRYTGFNTLIIKL